jgi:hypothetical protein
MRVQMKDSPSSTKYPETKAEDITMMKHLLGKESPLRVKT